ncbi:hypothetical protein NECAME_12427 [Necator americanus]|uniref:Uncharacterized protein n=1 Tax=Necator americanus TaxID=51031 RepID=W2T322_NECAM|nr:hypothetical protein NECAME_12427 [Necator americanus]ETN75372.1 hypothetical protein NECAME_12427 [Necator americanus]
MRILQDFSGNSEFEKDVCFLLERREEGVCVCQGEIWEALRLTRSGYPSQHNQAGLVVPL